MDSSIGRMDDLAHRDTIGGSEGRGADDFSSSRLTWRLSRQIAEINQLAPLVAETEQISDRRNFRLKSKVQISSRSERRFLPQVAKK